MRPIHVILAASLLAAGPIAVAARAQSRLPTTSSPAFPGMCR